MDIPGYDEFIRCLAETDYDQFSTASVMSVAEINGELTVEALTEMMKTQTQMMASFCARYIAVTLREYHEWLRKQF